ncbi:MAG TPA: MFS transporter [Ktedonobacterales bacterium]
MTSERRGQLPVEDVGGTALPASGAAASGSEAAPNAGAENGATGAATKTSTRRTRSWHVLRHRDYSLLFWGQLISAAGTQMQVVAVAWQVLLLTNSPIALGLIGLAQGIPRLLFSLVGGVFADALDRRKLLIVVNTILALTSTALALSTIFGIINIGIIYGIVMLASIVSSFEFPTRQAVIPSLVPREHLSDAVSLSTVSFQLTAILGATMGGVVLAAVGVANTYWVDVGSYAFVIGALLLMHVPRVALEKRARAGVAALGEGMRFLKAHPIILSALSLDFFATFFGSPRALLPIYAQDIYHAGAQGLGLLLAATSIGAVIISPAAGALGHIARKGVGVILAVLVWGACVVAFGLAPMWDASIVAYGVAPIWVGVVLLAGAGAADMVSSVLRGLIVQLTTPEELRGRISSVNAMFVIGGPMLGQFESGVVAGVLTPELSVVTGGLACILATLAIAWKVPSVLRAKVK